MRHIIIKESYESLRIVDDFYDYEGEDFYGNYGCEKIISRREANELYNYAMSKKLDMDNILWERDTLRFINYVGYIRLSTVSIEILPKISLNHSVELERKALLNMPVSYTHLTLPTTWNV